MNPHSSAPATPESPFKAAIPGLILATGIASFFFLIKQLYAPLTLGVSPLIGSVMLGMVWRNTLGRPAATRPGLALCLRAPLRTGIVLLGLQVTLEEIAGIGATGLTILIVAVVATFTITRAMGVRMGVSSGLATLIAAGTSVCGASAVVAANTVVRESDESVAYALATVTLFGTIAMFMYPLIGEWLRMNDATYGLWIGGSVHEVAQVVAAAFAHGQTSGVAATVAKLARVLMLAPLVLTMGYGAPNSVRGTRAPVPWFVFGFLAMVVVASTGVVSTPVRSAANFATQGLLALALAAVGLETDLRRLIAQGWRPLALGAFATVFIGAATLAATLTWQQ